MFRRFPLTLFSVLLAFLSFGQSSPLFFPVVNQHGQLVSIRVVDSLPHDEGPLSVDTVFLFRPQPVLLQPNFLGKAQMTPTAWGGEGEPVVYAGLGGTFPQIYSADADLIGVAGVALFDKQRQLGALVQVNVNDVSGMGTLSTNLTVNKRLSPTAAIAVGGVHLFASQKTDAGPSFFVVYSHAVQWLPAGTGGRSRLHYSLGAGTGRFAAKSPADQLFHGRSRQGTILFANASYEWKRWLNVNLEWSGINLHSGVSVRPLPGLPCINLGLADLLRTSGEKIRIVASVQYAVPVRLLLKRKNSLQ